MEGQSEMEKAYKNSISGLTKCVNLNIKLFLPLLQ